MMESRLYVEEKLRQFRERDLERGNVVRAELARLKTEDAAGIRTILGRLLIGIGRWLSSVGQGGISAGEALLGNRVQQSP